MKRLFRFQKIFKPDMFTKRYVYEAIVSLNMKFLESKCFRWNWRRMYESIIINNLANSKRKIFIFKIFKNF